MKSDECYEKAAEVLEGTPDIARTHGYKAASVRVAIAREWRMLGLACRMGEQDDV